MKFTDSHCHLDFDAFTSKANCHPLKLLKQCAEQNIHQIIIPAITPKNWQNVLALANSQQLNKSNCKVFACLGIHPWFLQDLQQKDLDVLAQKIRFFQ